MPGEKSTTLPAQVEMSGSSMEIDKSGGRWSFLARRRGEFRRAVSAGNSRFCWIRNFMRRH